MLPTLPGLYSVNTLYLVDSLELGRDTDEEMGKVDEVLVDGSLPSGPKPLSRHNGPANVNFDRKFVSVSSIALSRA